MSGQAKKADSKKGQKQAQAGATKAEDAKMAIPKVKQDGKDEAKDTTLLSTSVGLISKQEAVSLSEPSPMDMGSAPIKDPTVVKSHRSVRSESPEFNEQESSDSDVNHPTESTVRSLWTFQWSWPG